MTTHAVLIPLEEVAAYAIYDPATGNMYSRLTGKLLIDKTNKNYKSMQLPVLDGKRRRFLQHRVAFALVHGQQPSIVDHINGDPTDNRISNLRAATPSQNCGNSSVARSKTGFRGVYIHPNTKKFRGMIYVRGKNISIGYFDTPEEASEAVERRRVEELGEYAPMRKT